MRALVRFFVAITERWYPDPFVFAILLSFAAFVMALGLTPASPLEALVAWGDGLKGLLAFIAQISLTLVTAHALAHTDVVQGLLRRIAGLPSRAASAYAMVAFVAGLASLCAWSLGLVAGGIMARQVAAQSSQRLHYPLLVASAYAGFVVWHMGYSSSAALFVATPGHALEAQVGGTIPVTETLFTSWNLLTAAVTLMAVCAACALMRPRPGDEVIVLEDAASDAETEPAATPGTPAERLDNQRLLTAGLGVALALYLGHWFRSRGLDLNLNVVNWSFLCLGLLLARSPRHYVRLVTGAGGTVGQIILQYPLYAGIMGLMISTGLVQVIAGWFTAVASAQTLGFWAFVSAGLINFFIPSGGGQWAVQGPIFLESARALGTEPSRIVMAVAYGDQWTNMIQPFWTIPLLAIAGLPMRRIMGYTFVIFVVAFLTLGGGILLAGAG
jgi:short-chain fatty acids transporter